MTAEEFRKKNKRTDIDFSKHELIITKQDCVLIHHLQIPNNSNDNIKFINTEGILAVTGDYGNWIFCREFHPTPDGHVSDKYWLEKLEIASSQSGTEFNSSLTRKEIEEGIGGGLREYGYEYMRLDEMIEYYENLLNYVDLQEWEYVSYAYNNLPDCITAEDVPFVKTTKYCLKAVFDGFNEICQRLQEAECLAQKKNNI